jgi:energy-coupling factor transporter ATP-binding protein EcfA2
MKELNQHKESQLNEFIKLFIEHPILTLILNDFDRLRYNHKLSGEQQCMLITGDTGSGKSSVINHYQQSFKSEITNGAVTKRLLVSRIPSKPTLETTMIELLKDLGQFGSTYRKTRNNDQRLTESLIDGLRRCGTELIIINEFQELTEFKSVQRLNEVANRLKYINEEARIPIVLVGMPWAEKIAEEPQWSSRLMIRREIPYFKLSKNPQNFIQLIMGLANKMPFAVTPKLEAKEIVFALFAACKGCFRTLKHLLDESVKQGLLADAKTLEIEHMRHAFDIFYPNQTNPFNQAVTDILACEVKNYSRYDLGASSEFDALIPTQFTNKLPISQLLKKGPS